MVTVIIVHYYTPELLGNLLEDLNVVVCTGTAPIEVFVVNNGGDVSSVVRDNSIKIQVIELPDNPGYAAAINRAMSHAQGEIIFVMNCDISLSKESFAAMVEALQSYDVVGPRLLMHRTDRFILPPVEPSSASYKLLRTLLPRIRFFRDDLIFSIWWRSVILFISASKPVVTSRLLGAFLAFKRKVFEQVGPFDERFRLYFEEVDWLLRVRKNGYSAGYLPQIEIFHFFNQSAKKQPLTGQWFQQSEKLFNQKWFSSSFISLLSYIQSFPRKSSGSPRDCWIRKKVDNNLYFEDIKGSISGPVRSPLFLLISGSRNFVPSAILEVSREFHWTPEMDFWEKMENGTYYFKVVDNKGKQVMP